MGTTLTGTTPQDTYDSLIKVTDNGPLTGSLKKLTDGLGNDSSLSLSTTAASLSGTLAVTGAVTAGNNTNVQATSTNTRLLVTAAGVANTILGFNNSGSTQNGVVNNAGYVGILQDYPLVVTIADGEKMRITGTGNVGIGTSSPNVTGFGKALTISSANSAIELTSATNVVQAALSSNANGLAIEGIGTSGIRIFTSTSGGTTERLRVLAAGGLTFNGDTAQANALDDYEEGTWTPLFRGQATAGTYEVDTLYGTYTKVGRQVTASCFARFDSSITGGGTGYLVVYGLPFAKGAQQQVSGSVLFDGVDFTGSFASVTFTSSTGSSSILYFSETVDNGASVAMPLSAISADDVICFTITYFV
jgi:hypothetical protein